MKKEKALSQFIRPITLRSEVTAVLFSEIRSADHFDRLVSSFVIRTRI